MDSPELIILDVGHGNCALIKDANNVMVIDCPPGGTLAETLEHLSIKEILHILISHSDADHIAGIIDILANEDIKIHNVHINPDAIKKSEVWTDVRIALQDARKRSGTQVSSELTTTKTGSLNIGSVEIEILAPTPELILGGAGGTDLQRRRLTSNSISAVVGIVHDSHRVAILAADIDHVGFDNLIQEQNNLSADILVFPHHGGKPGSADPKIFTEQFCMVVQPKLIIFSIDRNRFSNPRIEIVEGIISSVPNAHILCTQLSERCTTNLPSSTPTHLSTLPARGLNSNSCCGGSISIKIDGSKTTYTEMALHKEFILKQVTSPICRRLLSTVTSV
ncbi:MBL fold metallo-hydrolase [Anabaena azotica FACHB-119]|uniref:MBL fold metallo-hydrolase n=2 Tax=Anabaena azotica TaxID=197653 RepID=A0ABR8CXT9_9NOST|nr:MBL fold metallo-hydrolase [Anabaena azotica FACHB-119]